MSKKENKSSSQRISKKEQRRQQVARDKQRRTLMIVIPVAAVVLVVLAFVAFRSFQPELEGTTVVAAAPGANHDSSLQIDFGGLPPMGGPHQPQWQNCGIYVDPVVRPENAIHSMEHGAVWVTYHPDLPAEEIASLQDTVRGEPEVLLSPYPDQDAAVVLTVWDRQLVLDSAEDDRVEAFITRYRNRSGPEASASCLGGIGIPAG